MPLQPITPGRLVMSLVAFSNSISTFFFDWNETHIYNPRWPPHARFHNGQTMSMGVFIGLLTLYLTWRPSPSSSSSPSFASPSSSSSTKDSLFVAALVGSMYWVTGLSANLYPGTLAIDPEFGTGNPTLPIFGVHLALTWVGYALEMRRLGRKGDGKGGKAS